jgi:hypothetical protein
MIKDKKQFTSADFSNDNHIFFSQIFTTIFFLTNHFKKKMIFLYVLSI